MKEISVGDLFSGIGGFSLGLERAGMKTKWFVENNEFCQKVLTKHWPDVPKYGDIRNVGKENLETVDLICGGFPCQPHSLNGKRKGEEDKRNLWPQFARVVHELRPRWVVAENVRGSISSILFRQLETFYDEGYKAWPLLLRAGDFGASHERARLFVIARKIAIFPDEYIIPEWADEWETYVDCPECMSDFGNCWHAGVMSWFDRDEEENSYFEGFGMEGVRAERIKISQPLDKEVLSVRNSDGQWKVEPDVRRVDDGVPDRMDRLKSLGNAVVPQVAEFIGRMIIELDNAP